MRLPVLLLLPVLAAVAARAATPPGASHVVVGGHPSHLQHPSGPSSSSGDVSVEAAAGFAAVLARLATPYPLSAADAERLGQLAAASPSSWAAAAEDAAGAGAGAAPRAAVLLHLLGVAPERAEALAGRVAATLADLGAGVVRHLRVAEGPEAAAALVAAPGRLAAANGPEAASFRVLESPGEAERCGVECLARRLGGDAADALRRAFGLDDGEEREAAAAAAAAVAAATAAAWPPADLLAGELASVLASLSDAAAEAPAAPRADAVRVYEGTITGMQALRAADAGAGCGGADARAEAAADAFLATLGHVHRAVAARHGDGAFFVQVVLLGDAPVARAAAGAGAAEAWAPAPAAVEGGERADGDEAPPPESSSGSGSGSQSDGSGGSIDREAAAALRAPYMAWKRNARRSLLQAAGAFDGDAGGEGDAGGDGGGGDDPAPAPAPDAPAGRPFGVAATYWGVSLLLVWATTGAVYCLSTMPLAEDTLLFGARRRGD